MNGKITCFYSRHNKAGLCETYETKGDELDLLKILFLSKYKIMMLSNQNISMRIRTSA